MRLTTILLAGLLTFPAIVPGWQEKDPLRHQDWSIIDHAAVPLEAYTPSPEDWRDVVIYQVITDRWFNGNPENDGLHPRGQVDPGHRNGIHGGDFAGLRAKLPYLKELGVSAVWISPVVLNAHGQYHGYHTLDFGRIDPKWGTTAELQGFIREAHAEGIYVFFDIITNHMANLIDPIGENGEPARAYIHPPEEYELRWRDESLKYPAPFDRLDLFRAQGPINYDIPESVVLGDIFNLDDLKTELPEVRNHLIKSMNDLITVFDIDGFRVDTTKHVEPEFWQVWCPAVREHAASLGKKNFMIYGEAWEYDAKEMNRHLVDGEGKRIYDSLLDFSGKERMLDVFARRSAGPAALKEYMESTLTDFAPHVHDRLVRFLDNHDGKRFLTETGEVEEDITIRHAGLRQAMAFMLTTGGTPIIYYGTEQGFEGGNADWSSSREDMFDGPLVFEASKGDSFRTDFELFVYTQKLLRLRAENPALRRGETEWLRADSEPGVLAYRRGEFLILMNTADDEKSYVLGSPHKPVPGFEIPAPGEEVIIPPLGVYIFEKIPE